MFAALRFAIAGWEMKSAQSERWKETSMKLLYSWNLFAELVGDDDDSMQLLIKIISYSCQPLTMR